VKLFVWTSVPKGLTTRYHDGRGAIAWAENLEQARELIDAERKKSDPDFEAPCAVFTHDPDFVIEQATEPKAVIFPNAGCC